MEKDYQIWTPIKKNLNNTEEPRLFFHEREIWYCHLGENIGFEQDGRGDDFLRPVVIIRKFNNEIFWGVPLTRTQKDLPFYFAFMLQNDAEESGEKSTAVLSQVRLIDAKRLRRMIGYISEEDIVLLKKKLKALLP
ncbi:MAG: type II toxin-antitoxin system PemK/MazF family toxin [Candidatus Kaiserbacteria bacterium]|nr:type II toxin-antitoxin system PemK/MazF family toxin [Candidatus Kaiserbacteria bacterium]